MLDVHVALYTKIDEPPLLAGGENDTVTLWNPAVTDVIVGAPGTVTAATGSQPEPMSADGGPNPLPDCPAITLHVYVFPTVRPVTVVGDPCSVLERLSPPSLDVHTTLYSRMIEAPPSLAGGEYVTVTLRTPGVAVPIVRRTRTVGRAWETASRPET